MLFVEYPMRVVSHVKFHSVRNSNVLIYWPHGFGDWVHFSHILPLLDKSNHYWMTRYGDDTVALMSGCRFCDPIFLGVKSPHCNDGEDFGHRHFDINTNEIDGSEQLLSLPLSLHKTCKKNGIDTILFTPFLETYGASPFPFHTKARSLLKDMVGNERLSSIELTSSLKSSVSFDVPPWVTQSVEAKLRNLISFGERKLCIIGRNGYTSTGKNWGHQWRDHEDGRELPEGEECREFMRLMLKRDKNWSFLAMEDRLFEGADTITSPELNCYSYAELFGTPDDPAIPFGCVVKALANLAALSIGVPAGVHHLCMAKKELPTVGLWIEHHPSWYDEPKEASIHILSRNLRDMHLDIRPGSFLQHEEYAYNAMPVDTRRIYGEQVLAGVEQLLGTALR